MKVSEFIQMLSRYPPDADASITAVVKPPQGEMPPLPVMADLFSLFCHWRWPENVPGFLSEAEGRALAFHSLNKKVLEIGAWQGKSTCCLAQGARSVVTVDTFDSRATTTMLAGLKMNTRPYLEQHLAAWHLTGKVRIEQGQSDRVMHLLRQRRETFDLIFVDGDHSYTQASEDLRQAKPILNPNGIIAVHDYCPEQFPGVRQAVNEWLGCNTSKAFYVVDTLAVIHPL